MTRDELLDLFRKSGALLEGHFRLSSGLHSPGYLQCALVLQHPASAEALGRLIAEVTREWRPTAVLSPALGGVVIGHEVGRALGVRALFAERQDGELMLRRGFMLGERDRVLVIEDVLTPVNRRAKRCRSRAPPARKWSVPPRSSIAAVERHSRRSSASRSPRCSTSRCRPSSRTSVRCARRASPS